MSKAGFTFDGIDPGATAAVMLVNKHVGFTPEHRRRTVVAGPRPGIWDFGTELGERKIELDIVTGDNANVAGTDAAVRTLAQLLDPTNEVAGDKGFKQLIFDTESDRYWLAKLVSDPFTEYLPSAGKLKLTMRCADPFAYSTTQYVVQGGSATLTGFSAYRQIPQIPDVGAVHGWNLVKDGTPTALPAMTGAGAAFCSLVADAASPSGKAIRYIPTAALQFANLPSIPVEPGKVISIAAQTRSDGTMQLRISGVWMDGSGNPIPSAPDILIGDNITAAYAEVSLANYTVPGNATALVPYLVSLSGAGIGFLSCIRVKQQATAPLAWTAADQQVLGNNGLVVYEGTTNKILNGDAEGALSQITTGYQDALATLNAWRDGSGFGGIPAGGFSLAANVASGTANASRAMIFGSTDWADSLAGSALRWLWRTGGVFYWAIRGTNLQNSAAETSVRIYANGANLYIDKVVAGVVTNIASAPAALSDNVQYWWDLSAVGTTVTAKLFADSPAGSRSATQVGSTVTATDAALTFRGEHLICLISGANPLSFGGVTTSPSVPVVVNIAGTTAAASMGYQPSWDTGPAAFAVSTASKFSGTRSLAITSTPAGNTTGYWPAGQGLNGAAVSPSTTYAASARVNSPALTGGGKIWLRLIQFKASGALTAANPDTPISGALTAGIGDWQVITGTFTTEADCAFVEVRVQLNTFAQRVTAYVDNVGLEQKAYQTLNSGDGQEYTTGTRPASSDTETMPSDFDITDFGRTIAVRLDHASSVSFDRWIWEYYIDDNNRIALILNRYGSFSLEKIRATINKSVNDGSATALAAGDEAVIFVRHSATVGLEMQISKNGGPVTTYSDATPEAKLPLAGTPTNYVGRTGWTGTTTGRSNGTYAIDRLMKPGVTAAQGTTSVQNPYAQQDESYESVVYRFDGSAAPENYAAPTLHVDVGGTYKVDPVVEITSGGAYTGNVTVTDANGNVFTWSGTLALHDVLKIDSSTIRAYLNGSVSMAGVQTGAKWPSLIAAQRNDLVVGGIPAGTIKAIKTTFRARWL